MRRFTSWVLLIGLGAGGMYLFQHYPPEERPASPARTRVLDLAAERSSAAAPAAASEPAAPAPSTALGAEGAGPIPPAPEEAVGPADGGVVVLGAEALAPEQTTPAVPPNPLEGADAAAFLEAYESAGKALAAGDARRGLELYRVIFTAARERADLDVSMVARKLIEAATGEKEKLEYYRYLAARATAPHERFPASLAAGKALAAETEIESVRAAWELLTDAYLAATSPEERRQVLDVLEPFIKRHVFSRRSSPLLVRHRVGDGEHLSGIADSYRTTVDAIRRLNGIAGAVIRPGQRLLVLPGKSSIRLQKREFRLALFVDGKLLLELPVGLGAEDTTPAGRFVIVERQVDPTWYPSGKAPIPAGDPRNILGSRWLGFRDTDPVDGLGIHGTPDESSIGRAVSSGCIRLRNADIELLFDLVTYNTEVVIEE